MKKFRTIFAVALLLLVSCGKQAERMDSIETLLEERPDSALSELRKIKPASLIVRSNRARYSLLHAIALDKNFIDTADISVIQPAVKYYRRHGSKNDFLKALYYQGRMQFNAEDYNEALFSYTEAAGFAEKTTDMKFCGMLYSAMALTDNLTYNRRCLDQFKKGLSLFRISGGHSISAGTRI